MPTCLSHSRHCFCWHRVAEHRVLQKRFRNTRSESESGESRDVEGCVVAVPREILTSRGISSTCGHASYCMGIRVRMLWIETGAHQGGHATARCLEGFLEGSLKVSAS